MHSISGTVNEVMEIIKKDINTYYGHAFERIVIDMIRNNIIKLPFKIMYVKRFWYKDIEIDAIAGNDETGEMAFIECKFSDNVDGIKVFNDLKYKSLKVDYKSNNETLYVNSDGISSECPVCDEKVKHPIWKESRCINGIYIFYLQ